jgi:hypothetical protein
MQIESLRLVATETELNGLMTKLVPEMKKIRDLHLKLLGTGISISGTYQTIIGISFETLWEVFIHDGKIAARLKSFKTAGLGIGLPKGYLIEAIAAATKVIAVQDETLLLDVDLLLAKKGLPLRTNLTGVRCSDGNLIIESGRVAAERPMNEAVVSRKEEV